MKNVGIICEYNPYHTGHLHQITFAREHGAECVVCVMSGNFTQRGEPAIFDKYTRAAAAASAGADIVLELPFPYSSLSAEGFARAGAYILDAVGVDSLLFGSECGDIDVLRDAADIVSSTKFMERFAELQRDTNSSTSAYLEAYEQISQKKAAFKSNDLLGISYIRAISEYNSDMTPITLKRVGSEYNDKTLGESFPSATALREQINSGVYDRLGSYIPKGAFECLEDAINGGLGPVDKGRFDDLALSFFRLNTPDEIAARAISVCGGRALLDDGDGIVNRLCAVARSSKSTKDFYSSAYNSRYTNSRINRVILYSMMGVSDGIKTARPDYTTLLAASKNGCEYLSGIRKTSKIQIVTKPSDAPTNTLTNILTCRADSLYSLIMPEAHEGDYFIKKSPFILQL